MIISIILIFSLGCLFHFLYDMLGHNKIVGLFSAVNESTWEHIKIALTAMLLWSLYDGFVFGENPNYFLAKLLSLLIPVVFIPAIFYSYQALTKKPILPIDILTFLAAIILAQLVFYHIISLPGVSFPVQYFACLGSFISFGAYSLLTLMPLKNFLFKDPISKRYGFRAHTETIPFFKKKYKKLKARHKKH